MVTRRKKIWATSSSWKNFLHELHKLLDVSQFHQESLEEEYPLVIFGLLTGSPDRLSRCTPGKGLSTHSSQRAHPLPATPCQCPRSRTATLGWRTTATYLPLRWPDCTLSRLRAEEYDRPVTQSIVTPEPSSAHCTWILTVFTSLACYNGALLSATETRLVWAGIGEHCRPRTTWRPLSLSGSPALPPLRLTGGFLPRRLDGTTPGW